jgi:hypothetical protein
MRASSDVPPCLSMYGDSPATLASSYRRHPAWLPSSTFCLRLHVPASRTHVCRGSGIGGEAGGRGVRAIRGCTYCVVCVLCVTSLQREKGAAEGRAASTGQSHPPPAPPATHATRTRGQDTAKGTKERRDRDPGTSRTGERNEREGGKRTRTAAHRQLKTSTDTRDIVCVSYCTARVPSTAADVTSNQCRTQPTAVLGTLQNARGTCSAHRERLHALGTAPPACNRLHVPACPPAAWGRGAWNTIRTFGQRHVGGPGSGLAVVRMATCMGAWPHAGRSAQRAPRGTACTPWHSRPEAAERGAQQLPACMRCTPSLQAALAGVALAGFQVQALLMVRCDDANLALRSCPYAHCAGTQSRKEGGAQLTLPVLMSRPAEPRSNCACPQTDASRGLERSARVALGALGRQSDS